MSYNNKIDYKVTILNTLEEAPSGLTINEIAKNTDIHRNTVSKYLGRLEEAGLVNKKILGTAHLYLSTKRAHLPRGKVNSFIRALLHALKDNYPNDENIFKNVGRNLSDYFEFSLGEAYTKEFEKIKKTPNPDTHLKLFKEFYNSFDFFQDDLDI